MRIVGIDLGTSSIKAVEVDSAFGRFEIHDYHEQNPARGRSGYRAPRVDPLPGQGPRPARRRAADLTDDLPQSHASDEGPQGDPGRRRL